MEIREMIIEVTEQHIRHGTRNNCEHCPIALAVNETFNINTAVVSGEDFAIGEGINFKEYSLPQEARDFIRQFDDGDEVQPFTFEARELIGDQ